MSLNVKHEGKTHEESSLGEKHHDTATVGNKNNVT